MRIAAWVRSLPSLEPVGSAFATLRARSEWRNVASEARPVLLAAAYLQEPRMVLVVVSNNDRALAWHAKLVLCGVPEDAIRLLPSGLSALFEDAAPETVALSDRIGALRHLTCEQHGIIIATPGPALERTLPAHAFQTLFTEIKPGDTLQIETLIESLQRMGYEPAEPVRVPGQFSKRGGILDVFPTGTDRPVRIELFDDQVESLREFDPNSQRSVAKVPSLSLGPSRETLYPAQAEIPAFLEMIQRSLESEADALGTDAGQRLRDLVAGDLHALRNRIFFDRFDLYRPLLYPDSACAVELLPTEGLLVLDDPFALEPIAARAEEDLAEALKSRQTRGEILSCTVSDFMLPPERLATPEQWLALSTADTLPTWMHPRMTETVDAPSMEAYRGQATHLTQTLDKWLKEGYSIAVSTDQPTRATAMLEQIGIVPRTPSDDSPYEQGVFLVAGNLAGGFHFTGPKVALITDMELFGVGRLKLPQRKFNEGVPITTVLDLQDGDLVVHINFGIGVFRGLVTRTVAGIEKEFLFIEYAAPDRLYVPADQLDRIQKYLNPGDTNPKLNRLTGGEWQRTVRKAREEAREFARDLIQLYAQRKAVQRVPFGPDSPWQDEMEATFPYVETPSQMRAIKDSKRDLTADFPMDRLVIGDVGFGKTEVAIRVAFKVAQAGKQVAILCPTTILSEQHYRNFVERLSAFPVRLELLNRFRTTAERKDILARIEKGEVDIVLGTHALLAQEIKFKDLGLVVIDEEHKFGVKQKEALKKLRVNVDILTLSATPIPRTLSMALMDIRQMSMITDPPPGRLPVRTFVRPYSKEVVREAILRELARGGQVYYVSNRVQGIYHVLEQIKSLVPNAKIAVGHGQMNEKELEPVMVAFIRGEVDILLSTTIVESGLDIPNANTLIVENADRMGLAQLYQLRGRVGRSDRQAYAYFLYQGAKELTENATSRLEALQEFSHLGAGYNLAFRDLQIRGAGDLLGSRQHGVMATVGYELYSQLIAEEMAFLKAHADGEGAGREYKDPLEGLEPLPVLDLPTNARIPESYIEEQAQRLYYYKLLMSARNPQELTTAEQEIQDRYGKAPDEVKRAFWIMRLRMRAKDLKIEKIDGTGGRLAVNWYESANLSPRMFSLLQKKYKHCYLSRGTFIWPYTGGPANACDKMLTMISETMGELDSHRAALGVSGT